MATGQISCQSFGGTSQADLLIQLLSKLRPRILLRRRAACRPRAYENSIVAERKSYSTAFAVHFLGPERSNQLNPSDDRLEPEAALADAALS